MSKTCLNTANQITSVGTKTRGLGDSLMVMSLKPT